MLSQSGQTENKSLKTVCNNLPENLRWSLSKWWNSTTQPKHAHAEKKKEENRVEGNMEERETKKNPSRLHSRKNYLVWKRDGFHIINKVRPMIFISVCHRALGCNENKRIYTHISKVVMGTWVKETDWSRANKKKSFTLPAVSSSDKQK